MSDYLGNILGRISPQPSVIKPRIPSLFEAPVAKTVIDSPVETDSTLELAAPPFASQSSATKRSNSETDEQRPLQSSDKTGAEPTAEPTREIRIQPRVKTTNAEEEPNPVSPSIDSAPHAPSIFPRTTLPRFEPIAPAESRPSVDIAPASLPLTNRTPSQSKPIFAEAEPVNLPANRARTQATPAPFAPVKIQPPAAARDREPVSNQITPHSATINRAIPAETKSTQTHRQTPATTAAANGITVRPAVPVREPNHSSFAMPNRREIRNPATQNGAAPQSSIHVTIGRVEVRATTSATPSRARSKKEPEMSLETYLQRRTDGGRR